MCSDPETAGDHKNGFILAYRCTELMEIIKQNQSRVRSARMAEQLPCQAVARFDEKIETFLLSVRPRSHHERIALQEEPEADRRDSQIDVLSSVDFQGF